MGPGQQLDRLGVRTVAGDRTMVLAVQPDNLGEHVRVAGIAFRTRSWSAAPDTARPASG
jgi:hypothetical protein